MSHGVVQIVGQIAIYFMVLLLPVLWVIFTDRFRRPPEPSQLATLFAILAAAGVLVFVPVVSIVAASALLALGIAWLSGRYALARVTYVREFYPSRMFPGDEAELAIRLENRKPLPLAWLTIQDPVHYSMVRSSANLDELLEFSGGIEVQDTLGAALVNRTAVAPFQAVVRTYIVKARARGVYTLGPAEVEAGDPFGIFREEQAMGGRQEVIVYPRIFQQEELSLPFLEAMGELVARRSLFEDPTLIAGSREYQHGDPLNRIHWKSTSRTGALQVRLSDPSTTAQLMVVVNLNTFQHVWQGVDPDRMESALSVAASLGVWALDKGFAVGIRSNGVMGGHELTPRLAPSANPRQQTYLLEHLARLTFSGRHRVEDVLLDESKRLTAGRTLVFVTPIVTPSLVSILTSRRLSGRVFVVYCGRFAAPVIRGLPIHLATPPLDFTRAVS